MKRINICHTVAVKCFCMQKGNTLTEPWTKFCFKFIQKIFKKFGKLGHQAQRFSEGREKISERGNDRQREIMV